jgi:hypothetical protein
MKINSYVVNVKEIFGGGFSDLASVDDVKITIYYDIIRTLGVRGYENMGTDLYDGDVYFIFENKPMGAIYA